VIGLFAVLTADQYNARCARKVIAIEWEITDGGGFVDGNMRVENIHMDETLENLYLIMVYADHERQMASYSGVCYNEITERGALIFMAVEYPLSELESPKFRAAWERFSPACGKSPPCCTRNLRSGILGFSRIISKKKRAGASFLTIQWKSASKDNLLCKHKVYNKGDA
jgi:hypothetical protein